MMKREIMASSELFVLHIALEGFVEGMNRKAVTSPSSNKYDRQRSASDIGPTVFTSAMSVVSGKTDLRCCGWKDDRI